MKHRQNSPLENMHALLECIFVDYANQLRAEYPHRKIHNATVFASAIPAFARFGYIKLVRKASIPKDIPYFLIKTIKRTREDAIWIPSNNFPQDTWDLYKEMKPYMHGDAVLWRPPCIRISKDRSAQGNEQNEVSLFLRHLRKVLGSVRGPGCIPARVTSGHAAPFAMSASRG